jgi:hypothetical protein
MALDKLVWLRGEIKTPPFSTEARVMAEDNRRLRLYDEVK